MARRVSVNDDNSTYKDHLRDGITVGTQPNFKFSDNSKENYWPGTGGFDITLDKEFNGLEDRVLSVGLLSKLDQQNQDNEADEIAAHYHSITTNSFGVLADVRNGGLKRDLSSAFLNDSDIGDGEWILEDEHPDIEESFDQSIYSHKEKLFKTVPLHKGAGANEWSDTEETELRLEDAILRGPHWQILGAFHNFYGMNYAADSSLDEIFVDQMPRITGDNDILFDPDASFANYLDRFDNNLDQINARFNFFGAGLLRPEPENHGLQPILSEFKYSHIPTTKGDNLALAMYPSVAFWNPYSRPIEMEEIYVEIPFHQVAMHAFDPSEYDRWRKWQMFTYFYLDPIYWQPNGGGGGGGNRPIPEPPIIPPPLPPGYFVQ